MRFWLQCGESSEYIRTLLRQLSSALPFLQSERLCMIQSFDCDQSIAPYEYAGFVHNISTATGLISDMTNAINNCVKYLSWITYSLLNRSTKFSSFHIAKLQSYAHYINIHSIAITNNWKGVSSFNNPRKCVYLHCNSGSLSTNKYSY